MNSAWQIPLHYMRSKINGRFQRSPSINPFDVTTILQPQLKISVEIKILLVAAKAIMSITDHILLGTMVTDLLTVSRSFRKLSKGLKLTSHLVQSFAGLTSNLKPSGERSITQV